MKKTICMLAIFMSACSPRPENVRPAFVDDARFSGLSCQQVRTRRAVVQENIISLSKAQRNARRGDIIGVALTGIPMARVTGGNVAKELAAAKGEMEALNRTQCP